MSGTVFVIALVHCPHPSPLPRREREYEIRIRAGKPHVISSSLPFGYDINGALDPFPRSIRGIPIRTIVYPVSQKGTTPVFLRAPYTHCDCNDPYRVFSSFGRRGCERCALDLLGRVGEYYKLDNSEIQCDSLDPSRRVYRPFQHLPGFVRIEKIGIGLYQ